jgi:hypothetical protein
VKEVRRPASAMANRKPVIYTRELSTEIEGRLVVGDQEIVGSPDMRQAVDVTKAGHESAGQNQPDSMTPSLKAQYRPHSAMSIRSGLKESFEAASGGSMSIPGTCVAIGVLLSLFSMRSLSLCCALSFCLRILIGCISCDHSLLLSC